MTSYVTPKKNTAFKFYVGLIDQSNTKLLKANPTIASGDFKVSTDGGAFGNLATLPSANPASGRAVMIDLSSGEMNGDNIVVQCVDAAGAEWCDLMVSLQTSARQIDDLAYPATTGRSMVVDASGLVDANMVKAGPTGSGTAQTAKDIGGAVPAAAAGASGGLLISGSNSGTTTLAALTVTGATTMTGGLVVNAGATITGSATGVGLTISGGGTSGAGLVVNSTSGDAVQFTPTAGHGLNIAANGTSKHGIFATGGTAGTSDGAKLAAGSGGVDIRGAITGNVTGNLSGSAGSVTGAVGSVTGAVGSVTGAVGSVTGAVGSVTGNVGGNVVGSVASVTAAVATTSNIKTNQALAGFEFLMTDSTNHNPATGLTVAATRSIDGAAFGACANSVSAVANGMYTIDLAATDLNGKVITLRFTATASDDQFVTIVTQP